MAKKIADWFEGQATEPRTFAADDSWVLPFCMVGVELELEGFKKMPDGSFGKGYWEVVEDHSLRAEREGESGYELRFRVPLCGMDLTAGLNDLQTFLSRRKTLSTSHRTSLHVHLDVRDMTAQELANTLCLYAIFEGALFHFVGEERKKNLYCVPWLEAEAMAINLPLEIMKVNPQVVRDANWKYAALNVRPIADKGSIEFRHHGGTVDVERIRNWIKIIMRLKASCGIDSTDLPRRVSHDGPVVVAREVFQEQFDIINYPDLEQDIWEHVRLAQDMLYGSSLSKAAASALRGTAKQVGKLYKEILKKHGANIPSNAIEEYNLMHLDEVDFAEQRYREVRDRAARLRVPNQPHGLGQHGPQPRVVMNYDAAGGQVQEAMEAVVVGAGLDNDGNPIRRA